jgi:hypothetical protein
MNKKFVYQVGNNKKSRTYNQFIQIQNINILQLKKAPFPNCRYVGMDPTPFLFIRLLQLCMSVFSVSMGLVRLHDL